MQKANLAVKHFFCEAKLHPRWKENGDLNRGG